MNQNRRNPNGPQLEIILPVFNEEEMLAPLVRALDKALTTVRDHYRVSICFINDGSTDHTGQELEKLSKERDDIQVVTLLHNFGHSAAIQAGLDHFQGDLCILMDADLQDSPDVIPQLIKKWEDGAKTVVVERGQRSESLGWAFKLFYRVYHGLAQRMPPIEFGTFSLLDASTVDRLRKLTEQSRYFPGLIAYASGPLATVKSDRQARLSGKSRVGLGGLVHLAITACLSFSHLPIRMVSVLGLFSSALAIAFGLAIIGIKLFTSRAIPGWASIMTVTAMGSGIQLLCLGLMGEYLSRIYQEVKARPLYFVAHTTARKSQRKAA